MAAVRARGGAAARVCLGRWGRSCSGRIPRARAGDLERDAAGGFASIATRLGAVRAWLVQVGLLVAVGLVALVSAAIAGASAGQLTIVGAVALVPVLAALAARGLSAGGRERAWVAEAVGVAALGVAWLWVAVA